MSIGETVLHFQSSAEAKFANLKSNPFGFLILSMLAGAYVGIGIILIMSVGAHVPMEWRSLTLGVSFGVALTLVVFAGAELFTGHTMYLALAWMRKRMKLHQMFGIWAFVWLGNLAGCLLLGVLVVIANIDIVSSADGLIYQVAEKKIKLAPTEMVARAMLCNWLVCLALWTSARTKSDSAKILLIFWCLFAFIASGFEHSVANMTVFTVTLLSEHPDTITWAGAGKNLFWVTLGNTLSGFVFVAWCYHIASEDRGHARKSA